MKGLVVAAACVFSVSMFVSLCVPCPVFADEAGESSVKLGRALFSDTELGSSGMSCSTCHPSEKKIAELAARDTWFGGKAKTLEQAVNICITGPLAGKALPEDSEKLKAIADYMRSLVKQ